MTESKQLPDTNGSPPQKGVENGNGKRSAAGLIVAGLVTVVGSWIGMAAYMDYRLQSMEERMQADTQKQVVSVADLTETRMAKQLAKFGDQLDDKITDTSSVLAKGLLDVGQKQDTHYQETLQAIQTNESTIKQALQDMNQASMDQVAGLLSDNRKQIQNEVSNVLTQIEKSNQNVTSVVQGLSRTTRSSGQAVLTAVQDVDNNLAEMNTGLLARMDSNTSTLQDLVNRSSSTTGKKLAELASSVNTVVAGANDGSKKLSTELAALAQRVSSLRGEIGVSQKAVRTLSASVPEWQQSSQQQLALITDSAKSINQQMESNISTLQTKISDLNQRIDQTAESLMRALYVTSEGMEGTKIELKSDLESSKQETAAEIRTLVQSVRDVSSQIEGLKKDMSGEKTSFQSNRIPSDTVPKIERLTAALKHISLKTNDLRSQIDSQVKEVKARTETILARQETGWDGTPLRDMLHTFTSLADTAGGQLDTLIEGLQSLQTIAEGIQGEIPQAEGEAAVSTESTSDSNEQAKIGLVTEDTAEQTAGSIH